MEDKTGLSGHLKLVNSRTGEKRDIPNTIMNVGKSVISAFIGSDIAPAPAWDWMSIGVSGLAAAATQTTLGSDTLRQSTTSTQQTTTTAGDTARFIGSFGISGTHAIVEAGLFNSGLVGAGSMLARTTFTALNVVSGDAINATWDVIVA